ncbi:MAG: hypothetical protein ACJA0Q_001230 [Saprospiraceae bacterium]|jgi:uncharacterized protein (TIGR02453 family)
MTITKENLQFLEELAKNNNRDWFNENKPRYITQHENTIAFADEVLALLNKHDDIGNVSGKKSLMRIYRDIRFSKDKSPYKSHWGGYFKRSTLALRGGYYFHIEPSACFVGGGFWKPESKDMKLIRDAIVADEEGFRKVIDAKGFKKIFGSQGLHGESLKNVPKGYDKESSAGDLLKLKQFLVRKDFTREEMLSPDFAEKVNETFKAVRPFFDWMSYALTHDGNGEPIH